NRPVDVACARLHHRPHPAAEARIDCRRSRRPRHRAGGRRRDRPRTRKRCPMKPAVRIALVAALLAALSPEPRLRATQPEQADGISSAALAQIDALIAEKESRTATQQKIDSQLVYELKMESGAPVASGVTTIVTDIPYAADGHIVVDVTLRSGSSAAARLAARGLEIVSTSDASLRAHINIDQVEALAGDDDVVFVQPRQDAVTSQITNVFNPTGQGSRSSEGDVTHLAFAARGAFHVDGTGVKIGVLSNGVRTLAQSQAAGDLGPVTVIGAPAPCPAANTCDEGTAMLEIVHDLAP